MNKEGYWLNAQTGSYYRIDEHARWLTRRGNPEKLDLRPSLIDQLNGLHWQRDRLEILLTGMHGGLVRVRSHGAYVTFEFTVAIEKVLPVASEFLDETGIAGPLSTFRMTNLRDREGIEGRVSALQNTVFGQSDTFEVLSEPIRLNYPEEKAERVLEELKDAQKPRKENQ